MKRAVPVLTLTYPVDLGLEAFDLAVQIVDGDLHHRGPVLGLALGGLQFIEALLLGQGLRAVRQPTQFGVQFGQFQQQTLVCHFSFHGSDHSPDSRGRCGCR